MADYHKFVDTPEKLERRVNASARALREFFPDCKTLVVCGHSSMAISAPVAYLLGLGLAVIRKKNEPCYDSDDSWPSGVVGKCVLIDDCVETGSTIKHVIFRAKPHTLSGIILYESFPNFENSKVDNVADLAIGATRIVHGVWRLG